MKKINDIWENYKKIGLIVSNTFLNIYKAKNKLTKEYVIIKEIKKIKINFSEKEILKEIEIMEKLESESSISLIEAKDSYYIITEYYCYMTLEEYIKKRKNPLSIIEIKEFLLELNKILKKMNDNKIIHRNLKLSNILLSLNKERIDKSSFKISDFGLININEGNISSKLNSLTMSFEILKREENLISSKSDIWSLGIIIYYLLFKEYPYNDGKYNIIKQNEENIILKNIDNKELNELVKKMLNPNVEKRISWEEYFNHSFFNNQFNQLDLPLFNINCKNHAQNYYAYCPKCKQNICVSCFKRTFIP